MRRTWQRWLFLIVVGVIYGVIGIPWVNSYGRGWISIFVYAVLVLAGVYCRCNREPVHPIHFTRKVRRTPQSL